MAEIADQLVHNEMFGGDEYDPEYQFRTYRGKSFLPHNVRTKGRAYIGIYCYLKRGQKAVNKIIRHFALEERKLDIPEHDIPRMSEEIQKDFSAFKVWYKKTKHNF